MLRFWMTAVLAAASAMGTPPPTEIDKAFNHLYNFNFPAAHAVLNSYIAEHPREALPFAVRSSAYLFFELDRLGILESEFFADDKRIIDKKKLKPDPGIKMQLQRALDAAQSRAAAALAEHPDDREALFAMCISQGVATDYTALVEKRQIGSLASAKRSYRYAQQLLRLDPHFYDAYLTTGITEYLVGSLPFFVRWFVRFDNVQGSKEAGVRNLQLVARSGHYLRPFAKILLSIAYLREKRPREAEKLMEELSREYPANRLIRKELAKLVTLNSSAGN